MVVPKSFTLLVAVLSLPTLFASLGGCEPPLGEGDASGTGAPSTTPLLGAGSGTPTATSAGDTADAGGGDVLGDPSAPPIFGADGMRDVLLVGNSVSGSVSFVDARTYEHLGAVDVISDIDEVLLEIAFNPIRAVAYPIVRNQQLLHHFEPSDGDRFVDDVFVSPDGGILYVSRSNLGDVAAFDLTKADHPRLWHTFVDGLKADHAALSPDGRTLIVSATTARVANVLDAATGEIIDSFDTGMYPHQNDYSHDGAYVFNASIGNVGFKAISHADNDQKGDRWLVKVDAVTRKEVDRWVFDYGIRPAVFSKDDRTMFAQISYLNGVIKYDLDEGRETARSDQPLSDFALSTYATYDEYPHDAAHHGLAMSGDGQRLCDCGTIDNTVTILATDDLRVLHTTPVGNVPYWATTGPDGTHCFVSMSGEDSITVIDYATGEEVSSVAVGRFPQRNRLARVPADIVNLLADSPD